MTTTTVSAPSASSSDRGPSVAVRMRPRLARERMWRLRAADRLLIDERSRCVVVHYSEKSAKELRFDHVFSHRTSQHKLYTSCQIQKHVKAVLRGDVTRASIIAYGQSGSGKTYSLYGDDECPAIIQHAARDLFKSIEYSEAGTESATTRMTHVVSVSFLQIVNERLQDLLDPTRSGLHVCETKDGMEVDGLSEQRVSSSSDIMQVLHRGTSKASLQAIKAAFQNTNSHTVVTLKVSKKAGDHLQCGRLRFVDLAGADNHSGTTASRSSSGARKSSLSLFTLSQVVSALGRQHSQEQQQSFVPYRNSTLTRILKGSLDGSCLTLILVCISPLQSSLHETINSLKFAAMAKYPDGRKGVKAHGRGPRFLPEVKSGYDPLSRLSSAVSEQLTLPGQMDLTVTKATAESFSVPLPQAVDASELLPGVEDDRAMEPLVFAKAAESVGLDPGDYILYLADKSMKPEQFAEAARNSGMGLIQFARHTASTGIHPMDFARHYGLLRECHMDDQTAWAPYLWDSSLQELLDYGWSLEQGIPTQDRVFRGVTHSRVFSGADAAAFFLEALDGVDSVGDAQRVGLKMILMGIIKCVGDNVGGFFATPTRLYQFCYEETITAQLQKESFLDGFPEATCASPKQTSSCTLL
eukprot:m.10968 g.10968  ORF g.10968 m.10968 type:complete len:639 (+) comp22840_c0_seq1:15-1931(+)